MISETTMKAIKKSKARAVIVSNSFSAVGKIGNRWYVEKLKIICKLDKMGYPVSKIYDDYNGSKIKIKTICRTKEERINFVNCIVNLLDNTHLVIRFMSNGTYVE